MKKDYNNELIKVKHGSRFHKITFYHKILLIREVLKNNKKGVDKYSVLSDNPKH